MDYSTHTEIDFTKLKYVIYARKSTDDPKRQSKSIPDQIAECKQLAKRLKLNLVAPPIEESRSAKKPNNRPKFRELLKAVRKGKYDGIIAWNPDRLARNMLEGGEIIDMIDSETLKDLKFVTHHFTKDANGKMLLGMAFVLSKQYSDKLSQDVTRGVRRRFNQGGKTPAPKHGYVNEKGAYQPDGKNYELICDAFEMRKKGISLKDIVQYLQDNGYYRKIKSNDRKSLMTTQKLSKIFKDSFYYGVLVQANQTVDLREVYQFTPAVSEKDFFAIQEFSYSWRKNKSQKEKNYAFYPLKGMVKCSFCNGNMYVAPSTGYKRYLYARCDTEGCSREIKSIRSKIIFDFVYDFLEGGLNLTEKEYNDYYSKMTKLSDQQKIGIKQKIHSYEGSLKQYRAEIKRRSLQIVNFDPDSTIYKENDERIAKLEAESDELSLKIAELKEKIVNTEEEKLSLKDFLNLSKNADTIVKSADARIKDIICRNIFLNFVVDEKKVTTYQLKEPFATLLKDRTFLSCRGDRTRTCGLTLPKRPL